MSEPIIGLDFGNYNSFVCYISDFDSVTKMGGIVHDLLPSGLNDGIPSVYFYSENIGTLCGENAVKTRATPVKNRIRYLKRHLGENMVIDNKTISYDSAITEVIQHCVRRANEVLQSGWQVTTNLVSLSYPATYTFAQRQRLIELAEKATLTDGTKIKVYGTIAEPAAAALDYLAEFAKSTKDSTVLVYDLGGGTFDLALVSAYPGGRKNNEGNLYYYDIINTRGIANVGGAEFDEIMFNLLFQKFNVTLKPGHVKALHNLAESTKIDLSTDTYAIPELFYNDDSISVEITRDEFEEASKDLLMKTINATQEILNDNPNQQPDYILLTGGASQMPMVKKELEKALPKFRGKIEYFRPSRAIAYGAARFGTSEMIGSTVQQRVMYDIGVRFFRKGNKEKARILTYISAGTPIPCATQYKISYTKYESQRYSNFQVFEAIKANPDEMKVIDDYKEIMDINLDHGLEVPKGTKSESRLIVDKLGRLTIEARELDKPGNPPIMKTVKLKNLSSASTSCDDTKKRYVLGCDIGNGYGYISLLCDYKSDPMPLFPSSYKLADAGMPTTAYVVPPRGDFIHVFDNGKSAEERYKGKSAQLVRAIKTRLNEEYINVAGVTTPINVDHIYSTIARDLLLLAEEELKNKGMQPIYDVVFTFPASFSDKVSLLERMQSSIENLRINGSKINVLGKLPEPAAVAIDYLHYMQHIAPEKVRIKKDQFTVLVYDLGHGTFDTAVVTARSDGEPYTVHFKAGLPAVGGKDFDQILYDEILSKLQEQYAYTPKNVFQREFIRQEAVDAKLTLSDNDVATISVINDSEDSYCDIDITRERFEELSQHLLLQTLELVQNVLDEAASSGIQIDCIVLSGGASKMPMVRNSLEKLVDGQYPIILHRPSEAVSYGAARFAYGVL